jgi:hypothetical protein
MAKVKMHREEDLAALAKKFREATGKTKTEAALEMKVTTPTLFQAEEKPKVSLTKLRMRMIEAYSPFKVSGPLFLLERK